MTRRVLTTSLAMGASAAIAGYVWVAFEFPFAIVLPAVVGVAAGAWSLYDTRRVAIASIAGGIAFTGAFLVLLMFALTDSSPLALPSWGAALVAAAVAGAITAASLAGRGGVLLMAGMSTAGMLAGIAVVTLMRLAAPGSVDVEGAAQTSYFALTIALVGIVMGGFIGAGVELMNRRTRGQSGSSR